MKKQIIKKLNDEIKSLPPDWFKTWNYVKSPNGYNHPRVIGLLSKILWEINSNGWVEHEFRFGNKFKPDLVLFDQRNSPKVIIDYESPNSSDARILYKDVINYFRVFLNETQKPEYLIITCLPNGQTPKWPLSYTREGYYNEGYKGYENEIKNNPFKFWYREYNQDLKRSLKNGFRTHFRKEFSQNFEFSYLDTISFININGNHTSPQAEEIKKNKEGFAV